jgi:hypothetical protein
MDDTKALFAGLAAFLGLNGLGQVVHRSFIKCIEQDPTFGCKNLAGTYGWYVGKWSEGEVQAAFFVASLLCAYIAWSITSSN